MKYIIVDFEMNPIAREHKVERKICRSEIIEIGAVILDESYAVIGEFKTLVRPQYNDTIYKKYEELTGISMQMVYGSPKFNQAYDMFAKWCDSYEDDYEIYAWSETDYKQVSAEMELKQYAGREKFLAFDRWFDFQKEFMQVMELEHVLSLEKALNYAGVEYKGHMHDALWDAKNTAELFEIIRVEDKYNMVLKGIKETLKAKPMSSTLGDMFDFSKLMSQME